MRSAISTLSLIVSQWMVVAAFTFLSTGCNAHEFTLDIMGDEATIGANVLVNAKHVGTMTKFGDKGARFAMGFPNGTLTVEVRKEGYSPYREVITVAPDASEHYVYVTLSPESNGKD